MSYELLVIGFQGSFKGKEDNKQIKSIQNIPHLKMWGIEVIKMQLSLDKHINSPHFQMWVMSYEL
jgi:hypothetical protein